MTYLNCDERVWDTEKYCESEMKVREYERVIVNNAKRDPKLVYSYINSKMSIIKTT